MQRLAIILATLTASAAPAAAQETPTRDHDASWHTIFSGPFTSSRLFAMPTADVVGAYQMSLSGDGSLLQETGVLSSAGVLAIGVGDIAQLEYRHTSVIGVGNGAAPIPAVGVQLKLPLRERRYVPAFALAFRLGVNRTESFDGLDVDETVSDLYLVSRLRLWGALERLTLHGGARISSAQMLVEGMEDEVSRTLVLPTAGWELTMNRRTRLVGEAALVPMFEVDGDAAAPEPSIGSGVLGRLGVRWFALPSVSLDASMGYQVEAARLRGGGARGPSSVVQWDIRLGAEIFLPWGAVTCRTWRIFCE